MDEVLGHAILFMLVGYDTTSNALTFTAYNLATNPECQEKLIDEIDTVLGKVRAELMILFTGKYKPQFYFRPFRLRCQRASFRLGEFKTIFSNNCINYQRVSIFLFVSGRT